MANSAKIKRYIKDLHKMRESLMADDKDTELSKLDEYSKIKHELSILLEDLSREIARFTEMKAQSIRNQTIIELRSENNKKIERSKNLWTQLKTIVEKID